MFASAHAFVACTSNVNTSDRPGFELFTEIQLISASSTRAASKRVSSGRSNPSISAKQAFIAAACARTPSVESAPTTGATCELELQRPQRVGLERPRAGVEIRALDSRAGPNVQSAGKRFRQRVHAGAADVVWMRIVPASLGRNRVAGQFGKARAPRCDHARFDEGRQKAAKSRGACRKELCAMVETIGIGITRCHTAAYAAGFLEQRDVARRLEFTRENEPGQSCADDSDPCHLCFSKRLVTDAS